MRLHLRAVVICISFSLLIASGGCHRFRKEYTVREKTIVSTTAAATTVQTQPVTKPAVTTQPVTTIPVTTTQPVTTIPVTSTQPVTTQPVTTPPEEQISEPQETEEYVLNTNTKKFHKPSCNSVSKMAEKNKQSFTGSREELIEMGYQPCKLCNP